MTCEKTRFATCSPRFLYTPTFEQQIRVSSITGPFIGEDRTEKIKTTTIRPFRHVEIIKYLITVKQGITGAVLPLLGHQLSGCYQLHA
jgi:hypothetical protein